MQVQNIEFIGSYPKANLAPKTGKPEYAFIGRSNVGKSSLINMLSGRRNLAHTSKKPGKTQTLNFFLADDKWYIVDLPGYGYAKVSKKQRYNWEKMIESYLQNRETLACTFVLVDANIPPQKIDIEFINWLGKVKVPFVIAYTKTDRLKASQLKENIRAIQEELLKYWNELPEQFVTSAEQGIGQASILAFIEDVNEQVYG